MAGTEPENGPHRKKKEETFSGILSFLNGMETIELEHFTLEVKDLELFLPAGNGAYPPAAPGFLKKAEPKRQKSRRRSFRVT